MQKVSFRLVKEAELDYGVDRISRPEDAAGELINLKNIALFSRLMRFAFLMLSDNLMENNKINLIKNYYYDLIISQKFLLINKDIPIFRYF